MNRCHQNHRWLPVTAAAILTTVFAGLTAPGVHAQARGGRAPAPENDRTTDETGNQQLRAYKGIWIVGGQRLTLRVQGFKVVGTWSSDARMEAVPANGPRLLQGT